MYQNCYRQMLLMKALDKFKIIESQYKINHH